MQLITEVKMPIYASIDHIREKELPNANTTINRHPANEGGYGEFSSEIDNLINKDIENIVQAVIFFSTSEIKLTEDIQDLTRACNQLVIKYKHLFEKPEEFKILWDEFNTSSEYHQPLKEIIPTPITIGNRNGIRIPEFDLETMAYHSYRHANEMYRDTYKKFIQLNFPESTCKVAATMAFFHDIVQKVDDPFPKPPLGKNEVISATFLNFLINGLLIDANIKNALKCLSNATIVGGTFLIKVLTPKGEKRNISLSQQIDNDLTISDPLFNHSLEIIKKMRHTLAENDVSRTLNKADFVLTGRMKKNPIIVQLMAAIKLNATSEQLADAKNKGILEENFGAHLISRLFQSIRFLCELNNIPVKEIRHPTLSKAIAISKIPNSFVDKLKLPTTWTIGHFSEMAFAEQNQHTDYVNLLREHSSILIHANPSDIQELILIALTEGQDGNFIDIIKEIGDI